MPLYKGEVEAIQWTGDNTKEVLEFCAPVLSFRSNITVCSDGCYHECSLTINKIASRTGWISPVVLSVGDYVLKTSKSMIHGLDREIFEFIFKEVVNDRNTGKGYPEQVRVTEPVQSKHSRVHNKTKSAKRRS